ncbi:ATPase WRNIP1 [Amyelois transitella]|uniref:ATPase WRNIP1 n=1 Tax=Amyelois transitella TaxID=680683 RepID=UPI0029906978|nr:ATPase WRNIP1 [Amyelois transitella]
MEKHSDIEKRETVVICPICNKHFQQNIIEEHVNKCLFLNTEDINNTPSSKRNGSHLKNLTPKDKKIKLESTPSPTFPNNNQVPQLNKFRDSKTSKDKHLPLAEQLRPLCLDDIVGQHDAFGSGSMLRSMLEQKKVPNMILWGPPGCGKTSLANVVANICKEQNNMRFVKLSATMAGINDVKEIVKVAKNECQFKRQTVLFMDEIHRFNKLQQDTFLPHVENGTITLIGATTENPSFSLNNALLSRCRVVVMQKLSVEDVLVILKRAINSHGQVQVVSDSKELNDTGTPRFIVEKESLKWLAEVSDGDARIALGALELALTARDPGDELHVTGPVILTLDDIKNGIKRSHMLYDKQGEEHYNTISAIHKSIRASDDNAALYWTTRALHGGEDPLYIARRLVRAACEDVGIADPNALVEAVACLQGCQHIGKPESDILLVQCAVRLARAPKSREVYNAMKRCQQSLMEAKGPLPPIPLHLRNASSKLMGQIGYGKGYNILHKDESGLEYMPEGLEHVDFFNSNTSIG